MGIKTVLSAALILTAACFGQEALDLGVITRIKTEAFERSQVMDHAFHLTDVHGPRLTGSPGFVAAAEWIEERLRQYGLINITRHPIEWGRAWGLDRFSAELLTPQPAPLIGFPLPWSPGTNGELRGQPILATSTEHLSERVLQEYFDRYQGRLKGRIVLFSQPRSLEPDTRVPMSRLTNEDLKALEQQWIPKTVKQPVYSGPPFHELADRLVRFFNREGVRMLIFQEWGKGGGVVEADRPFGANWLRDPKHAIPPALVVLSVEHYNRLARLAARGIPTEIAINIEAHLIEPAPAFNLTAEIPGTDLADELVMIGAHLDSWTGATGATDNAAGVSVMTEVMRILKAIDVKPRRTVRLALWGGHEGEGLGARTYVNREYGTAASPKPLHGKVTCYFNLDNGTGRIRGIYLQNNEALRPIFQRWFEPFHAMGAATVSINSIGGTDHGPFDAVGIPAFQFIQDPVEYATRTHHTNMDVYDRLQEDDLKQASTIIASFVHFAANRPEMLPRRPAGVGLR